MTTAPKKPSDLALSGLTKHYGASAAVDNITLRIPQGEMVALLGPSGCGKTTTLRMIAGLVVPTEGEVLIGGLRITHVPPHQRNIGMLFQSYALFPHLTIAENVSFGLEMRGLPRTDIARKVADALALVQLSAYAGRRPAALSGGQQQRVALARAVVIEPSLLLLDEPLGALDKNLRENMQVEIRQLQKRLGITAVLVTHDQEEAMTMADRIVIMRDGRIEQMGTPAEIYRTPDTRFVAGFIGASNFLQATVKASCNDGTQAVFGGGYQAQLPRPVAPGPVLISVRPEAVQVSQPVDDRPAGDNAVYAAVDQIIYRGQSLHVHMRLDDGTALVAHLAERQGRDDEFRGRVGDRVHASWSAVSNCVVADR